MSLSESERHQVIQWFQEQMGPEGGELMMKAIAPVGWGDIATNGDLRALEDRLDGRFRVLAAELRGEMAELRGEMVELRGELRGEMVELRGEVRGEMVELRGDMRVLDANLRTELANGLRLQTFAILGGGSVLAGLGTALVHLLG